MNYLKKNRKPTLKEQKEDDIDKVEMKNSPPRDFSTVDYRKELLLTIKVRIYILLPYIFMAGNIFMAVIYLVYIYFFFL